jgi:hypothetical protein
MQGIILGNNVYFLGVLNQPTNICLSFKWKPTLKHQAPASPEFPLYQSNETPNSDHCFLIIMELLLRGGGGRAGS